MGAKYTDPNDPRAMTLLMQTAEVPEWLADKARRTVAHNAKDRGDCEQLLRMLGLVEPPAPVSPEAGPAPGVAVQQAAATEWINTPDGRYRKCAGECGRAVRRKSDPPSPHALRVDAFDMCRSCYSRSRRERK